MSQPPEPTPSRPVLPADLPWGIHYMREDIQDLRQELRHEVGQLRGELKDLRSEVSAQINDLRSELKDLRSEVSAKLDSHFKWTIGTLITLAGLIVVVFKL